MRIHDRILLGEIPNIFASRVNTPQSEIFRDLCIHDLEIIKTGGYPIFIGNPTLLRQTSGTVKLSREIELPFLQVGEV